MARRYEYRLTEEDEGLYTREILQRRLGFSGRLIKKIKYEGELYLNNVTVKLREKGRAGDLLTAVCPEESSWFEPEDIPLDIVYEDGDLLIVNKQPGLVVHPTKNYQSGTLANALAFLLAQREESFKIRFVNRLDRDTSGLVIVAKNAHAQDFLSEEMEKDRVDKRYIAVVHGIVAEDGTVDAPIDKDPSHAARRHVTLLGYPSVTHYEVLERFCTEPGTTGSIDGYSLLRLKLDTGRTHQIRVHMSHIGHPLVGDELYGGLFGYDVPPAWMPRQALHAQSLELTQPVSGERIRAEAPVPADIARCLEHIRSLGETTDGKEDHNPA